MAYVDPKGSIVGGLLDTQGRVGISEGVNAAVLGKFLTSIIENEEAEEGTGAVLCYRDGNADFSACEQFRLESLLLRLWRNFAVRRRFISMLLRVRLGERRDWSTLGRIF